MSRPLVLVACAQLLGALVGVASCPSYAADAPARDMPRDIRAVTGALPTDPGNPFAPPTSAGVRAALFDGLTCFDKDGKLAPGLATGWTQVTPTSWRFVLRRNVMFSNGEPLTAAAVATTLDWLKTPDGKVTAAGSALEEIETEIEDERVVVLHTATPDMILPRRLTNVMIVAPRAWADLGPEAYARTPAVSGPFKPGDWTTPGKITLIANPTSWRKAKVDRLTLMAMPDHASRAKALIAGRADIAADLDVDDIDSLESANLLTAVTPAMAVMAIAYRQNVALDSPLQDVRVRRALNYAIDRGALNQSQLRGLGVSSGQPAARDVAGFNGDVRAYPYDPDKAKGLLDEAGYAEGLSLRMAVTTGRSVGDRAVYQAVVTALAKVGVKVDLVTLSGDAWADAVDGNSWDADVAAFSLAFDAAPTNDMLSAIAPYSCLKLVPFVCDKVLTDRIIAVRDAANADKRASMLAALAQSFHDDPPALYLMEAFDLFGVGRTVEGFAVANHAPVYENIVPVTQPAKKRGQ